MERAAAGEKKSQSHDWLEEVITTTCRRQWAPLSARDLLAAADRHQAHSG